MALPTSDLFARSQFLDDPQILTMTGSSVKSTELGAGMYLLYASAAVAFLQGATAVSATASSVPLGASVYFGPVYVTGAADGFIAAIGASGTVSIIKVS
jgi:hypothetical protein